jgi:glutathione S-transferase
MQLWSGVLSPFSTKVRLVLAEKGLRYELHEVPWSRKTLWGPKPAEFLAVSPHGKVPVLIDDGLAIYDSTVIIEYLEDRYPKPPMYPTEPAGKARCRQLEDEADQAMANEVTPIVQELFTKQDDASRDHARAAAGSQALQRRYDVLERELAGYDYLCGTFTVADIATFMVVAFAATLGTAPNVARHPKLTAWFERVRTRPTVAKEFDAIVVAAAAA